MAQRGSYSLQEARVAHFKSPFGTRFDGLIDPGFKWLRIALDENKNGQDCFRKTKKQNNLNHSKHDFPFTASLD
jgi:hypothetical protein